MKQEEKELLLKDLCGRLPYEVNILHVKDGIIGVLSTINVYVEGREQKLKCATSFYGEDNVPIEEFKPYLYPLSSMTEEQENEWRDVCLQPLIKRLDRHIRKEDLMLYAESQYAGSDWLNKNHFDYRGLIEKGLAIDATGLGIYE